MNPILITKINCHTMFPPLRLVALGALLLIGGVSSSCSTARGFGQDVEKTGDKIQEAATR